MYIAYNGLAGLLLLTRSVFAIDLNINDTSSVLDAAKLIKDDILTIYNNGSSGPKIPGIFPSDSYYWWESGLAWDSLINYWSLSGDDSIVPIIQEGLAFQVGPNHDYLPPNQTKSEGNDDQAVWALSAMTAAEYGLPLPHGLNLSWAQLAQNVFDEQVLRWDDGTCGGGLRWQIFAFNSGYSYKNSQSTGRFVELGARLARYTGNSTYSEWALRGVQWMQSVDLLTDDGAVYDGTVASTDCSSIDHLQWTSNTGLILSASAYMLNITGTNDTALWKNLTSSLIQTAQQLFIQDNIIIEVQCEDTNDCSTDEQSYKSIFARSLAYAQDLIPDLADRQTISDILSTSAQAAASACTNESGGFSCGFQWTTDGNDGQNGLGEDLNALEVILANLPSKELITARTATNITTNGTTGTATGNANNSTTGTQTGSASHPSTSTSGATGISVSVFSVGLLVLIHCLA